MHRRYIIYKKTLWNPTVPLEVEFDFKMVKIGLDRDWTVTSHSSNHKARNSSPVFSPLPLPEQVPVLLGWMKIGGQLELVHCTCRMIVVCFLGSVTRRTMLLTEYSLAVNWRRSESFKRSWLGWQCASMLLR